MGLCGDGLGAKSIKKQVEDSSSGEAEEGVILLSKSLRSIVWRFVRFAAFLAFAVSYESASKFSHPGLEEPGLGRFVQVSVGLVVSFYILRFVPSYLGFVSARSPILWVDRDGGSGLVGRGGIIPVTCVVEFAWKDVGKIRLEHAGSRGDQQLGTIVITLKSGSELGFSDLGARQSAEEAFERLREELRKFDLHGLCAARP